MNATLVTILTIIAALFAIHKAIHIGFRAPRLIEQGSPADFGISFSDIGIPTRRGKRLFAWWLPAMIPNQVMAPTILLMHGWGSNAELMLPLAVPLHRAGMNVLLLDARNHGRSDADNFSSMPRFAEDVAEAID